ncbi:MAG TPA: hypothetical protein VFG29_14190 [Syntrophales bacterium]|nr:hypothetical protein [Syntrophales bacterium]
MSEPAGSRLLEVYIGRRSLDLVRAYMVTTIDFLAACGDVFSQFKEGKGIMYGAALGDAVVSYLEKHPPISPRIKGGIIMNTPVNGLKFHDEGTAFSSISHPDLQPRLDGLFGLAGEKHEPLRNFARHNGPTSEGPLFQVRSDLRLNIGISHPL